MLLVLVGCPLSPMGYDSIELFTRLDVDKNIAAGKCTQAWELLWEETVDGDAESAELLIEYLMKGTFKIQNNYQSNKLNITKEEIVGAIAINSIISSNKNKRNVFIKYINIMLFADAYANKSSINNNFSASDCVKYNRCIVNEQFKLSVKKTIRRISEVVKSRSALSCNE